MAKKLIVKFTPRDERAVTLCVREEEGSLFEFSGATSDGEVQFASLHAHFADVMTQVSQRMRVDRWDAGDCIYDVTTKE